MKAVIQRVNCAAVTIDEKEYSSIGIGLLVLLGITQTDTEGDVEWLVQKVAKMRIFSDNAGKMNLSVQDVQGEVLVVSQFTLHAMTHKGNRPSFIKSARPEQAVPLYEQFVARLRTLLAESRVQTGIFGADMKIALENDGPVTIVIDSEQD